MEVNEYRSLYPVRDFPYSMWEGESENHRDKTAVYV